MTRFSILCVLISSLHFPVIEVAGQDIKGRVLDASNFQPLPQSSVLNPNDSTGTVTDDEGYFSLTLKQNRPVKLIIEHIGYTTKEVEIKEGEEFVRINMEAADTYLHEVVVRASHINEKYLNVPAAVNVIARKQLERNDETIIAPSLNLLPGVYMHSGSLNTNRITIRGIGARTPYGTNKIKAYFDDIPLASGEGEMALEDIDLSTIERVEVIKGPSSSIYGAGLGGTITLTSRAGHSDKSTVHAQILAGSNGLLRNVLQFTGGGNNSQIGLTYSNTHSDGYRQNSEYNRESVVITGKFYPNERSRLSITGTYTDLKAFIPSSIDAETFRTNPSAAAANWLAAEGFEAYDKASAGISYQYEFTNSIKNITSTFLSFRNANEPRPFDILRENTVATGVRSRFIAETKILQANTTISSGFEYFNDWYEWSTYENLYKQNPGNGSIAGSILSDNAEKRHYYNIFAQINIDLSEKLFLQSGVNFNSTSYQLTDLYPADSIDQSGNYTFSNIWSPRLGLTWKLNSTHSIYTSVSHGFSPPSLEETLRPDGTINPDIQPETGWSYEAGSKSSWFDDRLLLEISLYRIEIENLLVAERVGPDRYIGVNAGKTLHNGLELMINSEVADGTRWSVKPHLSASFMDYKFDDFVHDEQNHSGNDLTGAPSRIFNIGIDISSSSGIYFYSNYRHVGTIPLNDENSIYSDRYGLLNAKVGYRFNLLQSFVIDMNYGINNITDEKYASMVLVNAVGFGSSAPRYFYPGLPRNYYGSISLRYLL